MAACLVGEPTCPEKMGEMIKIGRRGSLSALVTARGRAGPFRLSAPRQQPAARAGALPATGWPRSRAGRGTEHFDPSTLAVTTIDTGNPASNVIPAEGRATVNIRFNDRHSGASA
jgi:succinyl-diaminopimelate desuccinylase